MNILARFEEFILRNRLFTREDHLLLAVSGGLDSVVLCELCKQGAFSFSIAHCNFQLRGEESERDKEFVLSLALKYKVPLVIKDFETASYSKANKLSIQ